MPDEAQHRMALRRAQRKVRAARHDVYDTLRKGEQSLMSRGIYRAAAEDSSTDE